MSGLMFCPDCAGSGEKTVFADPGFRMKIVECHRCGGEGLLPTICAEWIAVGAKCKQRRMALAMTFSELRTAKESNHWSWGQLSDMELGIRDPAPLAALLTVLEQAQAGGEG
jgi:hypothetical protein